MKGPRGKEVGACEVRQGRERGEGQAAEGHHHEGV
jgi:hypothetical protein